MAEVDLDAAARACLAGRITREEYHRVWSRVVAVSTPDLACGHGWADGQRVWRDGAPTGVIRCRVCGSQVAQVASVVA